MCCPGAVLTSDLIIFARPSPYNLASANAFHIVSNTGLSDGGRRAHRMYHQGEPERGRWRVEQDLGRVGLSAINFGLKVRAVRHPVMRVE